MDQMDEPGAHDDRSDDASAEPHTGDLAPFDHGVGQADAGGAADGDLLDAPPPGEPAAELRFPGDTPADLSEDGSTDFADDGRFAEWLSEPESQAAASEEPAADAWLQEHLKAPDEAGGLASAGDLIDWVLRRGS